MSNWTVYHQASGYWQIHAVHPILAPYLQLLNSFWQLLDNIGQTDLRVLSRRIQQKSLALMTGPYFAVQR